jgi:hypothetical protein
MIGAPARQRDKIVTIDDQPKMTERLRDSGSHRHARSVLSPRATDALRGARGLGDVWSSRSPARAHHENGR